MLKPVDREPAPGRDLSLVSSSAVDITVQTWIPDIGTMITLRAARQAADTWSVEPFAIATAEQEEAAETALQTLVDTLAIMARSPAMQAHTGDDAALRDFYMRAGFVELRPGLFEYRPRG